MSKRKSKNPRKPDAAAPGAAKPAATPKRAALAADLARSEGEELQAVPKTQTRPPERLVQETETKLPPAPPPELESKPTLPPHLVEPQPVAAPAEARAGAREPARTAMSEVSTAGHSPKSDGARRAIAGMEACQTLFMEITRDNLDFAASLASTRSPLDILGVATKFASRQIGTYGRFSKAVADIAAGRQAPTT